MKETNIEKIREQSIIIALAVPIKILNYGIVSHPFTSSHITFCNDSNLKEPEILDLTKKKDYNKWINKLKETINKSNLLGIYLMINKPYKLTWLKYCKDYMSKKDFAEFFADAWVVSENPNGDINVKIPELIKWYKEADKDSLMVKKDIKVYNSIPETIILYRGVSKGRNPYGLSYTASKDKAEWFQNRFYKGEGFLIILEVSRKNILAYFNTRNEDEYVVDTNKYKKEIKEIIDNL